MYTMFELMLHILLYTSRLAYIVVDEGDGEDKHLLKELQAMLYQYIISSQSFQRKITTELENLQQDILFLSSIVEQLDNVNSSDSKKAGHGVLDEQMMKRLDNIVNLHAVLARRVEEVDGQVNLLTGEWQCAETRGWRRVGFLDMTNASEVCPPGWQLQEMSGKRLCGRTSVSPKQCDSTLFLVNSLMYSKVCGKLIGYQFGGTTAFLSYHKQFLKSLNDAYVDGVSITHSHPRRHIWTFAAGGTELDHTWPTTCPCDATVDLNLPKFIDKDFFCESGLNSEWEGSYEFYPNDPLWDGKGCTGSSQCCTFRDPPYFVKRLSVPTSSDIEVRLCGYTAPTYGNVLIEHLELYVQ